MQDIVLQMSNISKSYSGVKVLYDVILQVTKGTVHALMGENGAGKSTLMKILTGNIKADAGEIFFEGKSLNADSPMTTLKSGISMIHQELNPVPEMTVAENLFLGREQTGKTRWLVNDKKMIADAEALFQKLEIESISPKERMGNLSIAQIQMVEIAKAVSYGSRLVIMDEPTSAISEAEVQKLFKIIRSLKEENVSIIYISHKMDEIFEISDEISVLRDGHYIGKYLTSEIDRDGLIAKMVGRELKDLYVKTEVPIGQSVLEVQNFTKEGLFHDVNFYVKKGEILGIAGLMGAGRTEIAETIFGMRGGYSGKIIKDGKEIQIRSEADAIQNGIVLATEDRKKYGLVLELSTSDNIALAQLGRYTRFGLVDTKKESADVLRLIEKLNVKVTGPKMKAGSLSGGNQQKLVLAKWLLADPDVLILDEPTRGIDVGAKSEIYKIMTELTAAGKAIIMISSEMPELLAMSNRIVVVHEGKVTGTFQRDEVNQELILDYASR